MKRKLELPDGWKFKKSKGESHLIIQDLEGDEIRVDFLGDESVEICTDNLSYIQLSTYDLFCIMSAVDHAESYYQKYSKKNPDIA